MTSGFYIVALTVLPSLQSKSRLLESQLRESEERVTKLGEERHKMVEESEKLHSSHRQSTIELNSQLDELKMKV